MVGPVRPATRVIKRRQIGENSLRTAHLRTATNDPPFQTFGTASSRALDVSRVGTLTDAPRFSSEILVKEVSSRGIGLKHRCTLSGGR